MTEPAHLDVARRRDGTYALPLVTHVSLEIEVALEKGRARNVLRLALRGGSILEVPLTQEAMDKLKATAWYMRPVALRIEPS